VLREALVLRGSSDLATLARHIIEAKRTRKRGASLMTTQTTTSEYLVICRGARFDEGLSPEDTRNTMKQFYAWFERMSDQGKMKSGHQLAPEGKILSGRKGVTDGPFAESKEGIAGYWFIQAASLEEAVEIAKGDPLLDYGHTIEIRPILPDAAPGRPR
jgi:hypothetical protein